MNSTLGGDDPDHDLSNEEKDELEKELRELARDALKRKKPKDRQKFNARAVEVSRAKSKRAHQ